VAVALAFKVGTSTLNAGVSILAVIVFGVSACSAPSKSKTQASSPSVATVAGQPISQDLFNYYVLKQTGVAPEKVDAALKDSLLGDLKRLKAAALVGESEADLTLGDQIELQRLELLAHAAATAAGVYSPPSDADLQAEYERFKAALPAKEFHVAHILVAAEKAAEVLTVKLQSGADFSKLAREQSADESNTRGGDLGWISAGKLPVDFMNAIQALKPGQITAHPVHTIYGWHVIKLVETRSASAPPFEEVKAQIAANLQQARYKQFLESAAANAKIYKGT
jgi:peptidyl-prolyl cis-trans isomerase C